METLYLKRIHPMNRKQRLLEYLKTQEIRETKAKEEQIEREIEAAFEELVGDSNGGNYKPKVQPKDQFLSEQLYDEDEAKICGKSEIQTCNNPTAKKQKLSEQPKAEELCKYSEKFESVVETANILHQQLQDVTKDGIILCDATTSVIDDDDDDDEKTALEREHSPVPENKKKQRVTKKPVKRILHITGDSTLEYFEDCQTIEEIEHRGNSKIHQKKKKKRQVSKKASKEFVHITGDSSPDDFESSASSPVSSSNASETEKEAEFSSSESISFPHVSPSNSKNMVIGPNETILNQKDFKNIDWTLSAPIVTRKLLLYIFGRDILSTHSLTGKPSPAFLDQKKPLKKPLDAKKVADIIYIVTMKKDVKAKEVRLAITSKCADEQKMRKTRLSK